jgi:hypothetical protein
MKGEQPISRRALARRPSRLLLAVVGLLLVMSLFPAGHAAAHVFTKLDGNDSPGKIDLRSASVSHTPTGVVHRISTFNAWTPRSLGNDSFFVIQIDKNNDRKYERCAFIFYTNRLRGSLSNCGARFIRFLPVAKLSGTAARVTIPKSETGGVYWWGAASLWDGPRPCARGCVDFVPNRFPDILHDLIPPIVAMPTATLFVGQASNTATFDLPFSATDAHSGIASWTIQRSPLLGGTWANVQTGFGGGAKSPLVAGTEGTHHLYRVVAKDKHGNLRIGPSRAVLVPLDDDSLDPSLFTGTPATVPDANAFGGSYQALDQGEVFTWEAAEFNECMLAMTGPGSGTWVVDVHIGPGTPFATLNAADYADEQRQLLFDLSGCVDPSTITFTVTSGTGFGVDSLVPPA